MKTKKISVILPAYNAQETIGDAIQSIIDQTYTDWELFVINDGSIDNTKSVILSFNDSRIKYIENESNKKLIYTLNRGLELATGEYVARMDADDISLKTRFEKQVEFMENHQDVVASGGGMLAFSNAKITKRIHCESDSERIKLLMFNTSPIYHPTAIIRQSVLKSHTIRYNQEYLHVEDYMLWYNLSKVGKLSNIDEILIKYRISGSQISTKYNYLQLVNKNKVRRLIVNDFLHSIGFEWSDNMNAEELKDILAKNDFLINLKGLEKKMFIECLFIIYFTIKNSPMNLIHYYKYFYRHFKFPLKYQLLLFFKSFGITNRWDSYSLV